MHRDAVDPILPTILVADDDAQIRAVLGRFLSRDGFNVLLAADGREALDLFARPPGIAVAVIDLVMPNREASKRSQRFASGAPA